ncbi:MAG: glutamine--tRNA ligase, partial [Verrucomicrobiota bacterium]|nr:glutamine--tRNA ligase [Verrucomicrobiota bacterium]
CQKDADGNVIKIFCSVDLDTLNKNPQDRKVKGVIHWVSIDHMIKAEIRLFDRLFKNEKPDSSKERDFTDFINEESKSIATAYCEPSLEKLPVGVACQFERIGYFCLDTKDSQPSALVFNRTVALRDSWPRETL